VRTRADTTEDQVKEARSAFDAAHDAHKQALETLEAAKADQRRIDAMKEARAKAPVSAGLDIGDKAVTVGAEAPVYARGKQDTDYFLDLYHARVKGDTAAAERLQRNNKHVAEKRDLTSTAGAGGEYAAPLYMQDEFLELARAGRPTANAIGSKLLPANTNTIHIPTLATGTATAVQADGGTPQETDATTGEITVAVKTILGQQDMSRQIFDRSNPAIDSWLTRDLARDAATKLDVQVLNGSGSGANAKGILQDSNAISVSYTDASPTPAELYPKVADAIQQIGTNLFLPPQAIIMHPRRWYWLASSVDTTGRPLVVPKEQVPTNAIGIFENVAAENVVGTMLGLPVLIDASIPITGGGGTEDSIIVTRLDENYLWEGDQNSATYFEVLSGTFGVRVQVWHYFAFTSERYSKANAKITGTGLAAPTF